MSTHPESLLGVRALVVEDEILIAEELRDRLTRLGLEVVDVVDTGEGAVAAAERHTPHLIMMDIRLKGDLDGISAAEAIRSNVHAPVIFLTAHSDEDTLRRAKDTEPFGYDLKPFEERELVVAIEMSLQRHRVEQRLKESERRYAATLASIGEGVIATDPNGRVTFMNPVAEALTQWRLSDARGLDIDNVFPLVAEVTQAAHPNPARQAIQLKRIVTLTEPVLMVARDRQMIPIDDSGAPITDGNGNLLGAVVAFRDIRQRRMTEDALKRAEDELRHAQRMEAIGRLVGGIAHDFNNLLMVINGSADLVLSGDQLDPTSRSLVTEIKKAGDQAAGMTRRLLAFSRKQVLQPTTLHLGKLVDDISQLLRRLIGEDIVLTATSVPDLHSICADPGQIEQVILNLAVNARDAMPNGGQLTIRTSNVDSSAISPDRPQIQPGQYVQLSVSDNGVGIDENIRRHIFEPFFTTKERGKGTGLGLATTYGIVKQSGGFIYLHSALNEGTTFDLYFPSVVEHQPQPTDDVTVRDDPPRGRETILLVEDDNAVRSLLSAALRRQGYTIHEADSGAKALELFAEYGDVIQLVVTDVVMRGMNGREVSERVRAAKPDTPVLFLSGYTDDAMVRHGVRKREVAFLQKPFTVRIFEEKVREVLDQ